MTNKIAVVTGANKGIGLSIVKELLKRGVRNVYLTARNEYRGKQAIENLKKEGLSPHFHQLEVTDQLSVKKFANYIKSERGGIDILINNAGVITKDFHKTTYDDAKRVINVNYKSYFIIQDLLFPILNDNARVVNIASDCGHISNLKNHYWIERLTNPELKVEDIEAFVDWFLNSVKNCRVDADDFVETELLAYKISKIALCALTRLQAKSVGRNISINSMHPGLVQTDMTKNTGNITMEDAGKTPVYLALDLDQSVKGKYFWFDKTEKEWTDPNLHVYFRYETMVKFLRLHRYK